MGWCKRPFQAMYTPGYTQEECNAEMGDYSSTDPSATKPDDKGWCFVKSILTRSMAQVMLDLGRTYQTQVDMRDKVLNLSPLGRRMVKLYYEVNPTMLSIAMGNPLLLGTWVDAWTRVEPYCAAVIAVKSGSAAKQSKLRFTRLAYGRFKNVFALLRSETKDKRFLKALDEIDEEIGGYVGMTAEQAVGRLERKGAGGSGRGKARKSPAAKPPSMH